MLINPINIIIKIPQSLLLSPILYFFYNTNFFKINTSSNIQTSIKDFINNTVLLATSFNIIQNCEIFKKIH